MTESLPDVILIEDSKADRKSIVRRLRSIAHVHPFRSISTAEYLALKARRPATMVVVLDLEIDGQMKGLQIMESLWQVDRTSIFIVFSKWVEVGLAEELILRNSIRPSMTFVSKSRDAEGIGGLEELATQVSAALELVMPPLSRSTEQESEWNEAARAYQRSSACKCVEELDSFLTMLERSRDLRESLRSAAIEIWTAGAPAREIGIATYGSCGRGEMRLGSDVELSAYVSTDSDAIRRLAIIGWLRVAGAAASLGAKPEGAALLARAAIDERHAHDSLADRFMPVMDWRQFQRRATSSAKSSSRDIDGLDALRKSRQLQVLLELKSVFNPAAIHVMRRAVAMDVLADVTQSRDLLKYGAFGELFESFESRTPVERLVTPRDVKTVTLRYLNHLATRFELLRMHLLERWRRADDAHFDAILRGVGAPGLVKVFRFAVDASTRKKKYASKLHGLAAAYARLMQRFGDEWSPRMAMAKRVDLMQDVKSCLAQFSDSLAAIGREEQGKGLPSWVIANAPVRERAALL